MALTSTFGPARPDDRQIAKLKSDVKWLYVMTAVVHQGGFAGERTVAASSSKEELANYYKFWVVANKTSSRPRIEKVPYLDGF